TRRLLATHYANPRIGPHPQLPRAIGTPAHAVITGAVATADNHREFRHGGVAHRHHHLGAVLGDAAAFVLAPHHKAGDVLQKDQRHAALATQLDKMRGLLGAFAKQHAVVGDNADGVTPDARKARHQRVAIELFEFMEATAVHNPRNHFA